MIAILGLLFYMVTTNFAEWLRIIPRIFVDTFSYPLTLWALTSAASLPHTRVTSWYSVADLRCLNSDSRLEWKSFHRRAKFSPIFAALISYSLAIFYFHDLCCFTKGANFHPLVISYPIRFAFFYLMYLMTFLFLWKIHLLMATDYWWLTVRWA